MEETTLFDQNLSAGQAGAHDDFDWSVDKRNVSTYNQNDRETYDKQYEQTFQAVNNNEMVMGAIVGLTKTDAVVNIGYKSDGLISLNEFRDLPNVKVGDEVVTNNYSTLFPVGIPIGFISEQNLEAGDNFHNLKIELYTDFSTLKSVYVISNILKEEQKTLENNLKVDN
jgi:cell shape-determining protein MreC